MCLISSLYLRYSGQCEAVKTLNTNTLAAGMAFTVSGLRSLTAQFSQRYGRQSPSLQTLHLVYALCVLTDLLMRTDQADY